MNKNRTYTNRLRRTLIVYVVAGFLVIGLVMSSFSLIPVYPPLRENALNSLMTDLQTGEQAVQSYQHLLSTATQSFSQRTDLLAALSAYAQGVTDDTTMRRQHEAQMNRLLEELPDLAGLMRLDYNQNPVAQAGLALPESLVSALANALPAEDAIQPMTLAGQSYLLISVPVVSPGGLRLGTDLFLVEMSGLQTVLTGVNERMDAGLIAVGLPAPGNNHAVYRITADEVQGPLSPESDELAGVLVDARSELQNQLALPKGSGTTLYAYGPINASDWTVAVSVPESRLMAPVVRQIFVLIGLLAALLVVGGVGMSFVLRPLADRILIHSDDLERQISEKTAALQSELQMRHLVEDELMRLRNQNLLILNSAGDGILGLDQQGLISFANEAALRYMDYDLAELMSMNGHSLWHHSYPDGSPYPPESCPIMLTLRDGQTRRVDDEVLWRADGSSFPVEYTVTPVLEENQVTGAVITFRDISERREAEQALRDNEERYRTVVAASTDAIFVESTTGMIEDCNDEAARLYGYVDRSEMIGLSVRSIVPAVLHKALREEPNQFTKGGALFKESVGVRKNGEIFPTEVSMRKATLGDHEVIICFVRDISVRKRTEESLRSSEEKFSRAFHANPTLMAISAIEDGRYIDVNRAFEELTGYARSQVIGKTPNELNLFANSDERQDLKNRLSQTGRLQSFQAELRTRSGDLRVGLFSAEIIEIEGQKRQLTAMSDMTERYDREREWEAIATMASALRTADTRAEMLAIIIDQVMRLVKAQGVVFVMRDPNTNQLVMERGGGEWSTFSGMEMPERMSACHMVISTGQRYLNNDVLAHPDLVCEDMVPGIRAVTGLPVITQNSILGALMVGRSAAFSDAELRTLSAVCDIAASAIQRATLHDQTEQRLQRLAALHNIDLAITAGLDLPMVQSILLAQAAVQLGNDASRILLLSPSSKSLRLLAMQGFRNPLPGRPELPLEDSFAGQVATERRMVSIPDLRKVVSSLDNEALPPGEDFVTYHGVPLIAKGEVKGVLEIFNRAHYRPNGEWLEFLENLADQAAISIYNAELYSFLQRSNFDLEVAYDTTLEGWARALEMRDRETEGHSRRVADRTVQLALVMGIPERDIANVRRGALLHDIGKMMVPDRILFKEGPLDAAEWAIMMQHPESAARLLEPIPFLRNAITIPYCHHERWDGSGYPRHLKGEEIPLAARIFAVVDVFDALLSDRPYRQAWPVDEVIHYICAQSGIQFDPAVVAIFVEQVRAEREANSQVQPVAEM